MTDVIDSLKRLERAGSANSKTTMKLIDAAGVLSVQIAGYFDGFRGAQTINVSLRLRTLI